MLRATLEPQVRHLGIYSVPVYETTVHLSGAFDPRALSDLVLDVPGRTVDWQRARIVVPVADVRGIRKVKAANWGGGALHVEPGAYETLDGIGAVIDIGGLRRGQGVDFDFEFDLAGSQSLRVLPLAQETTVQLASSWPHPNFSAGAFVLATIMLVTRRLDWSSLARPAE